MDLSLLPAKVPRATPKRDSFNDAVGSRFDDCVMAPDACSTRHVLVDDANGDDRCPVPRSPTLAHLRRTARFGGELILQFVRRAAPRLESAALLYRQRRSHRPRVATTIQFLRCPDFDPGDIQCREGLRLLLIDGVGDEDLDRPDDSSRPAAHD